MEIARGCRENNLTPINFTTIPIGAFRVPNSQKKSKTIEFFEDLYAHPPSFRVKWNTIDELHDDLFMSYNYRVLNPNLPNLEVGTNFSYEKETETTKRDNFTLSSYLNGYLNKITSTRMYGDYAKRLQKSLQTIPVYFILNGQGEIVLATSTDSVNSNTGNTTQLKYDLCGNFDPLIERSSQLGLFFMSKVDAELYLTEIAKADIQGTKMFGLSIHCLSLDFAYRVMREYHPNVDFRFVPDLNEVQTILATTNKENSNFIFEDDQQQLRLRRRSFNLIPFFTSINKWVSPLSSFLEKKEYFKGVPIYVINISENPSNLFTQSYRKSLNLIDSCFGRLINTMSVGFGFGNGWILQGSLSKQYLPTDTKTFVFFEKNAALDFCQSLGQRVNRFSKNRSKLFESQIQKPKILVHNLEDFLELLEDQPTEKILDSTKQNSIFKHGDVTFVPSTASALEVENYLQLPNASIVQKAKQFFDFKTRRLTGFMQTLLNTN